MAKEADQQMTLLCFSSQTVSRIMVSLLRLKTSLKT
jgi:hypothetical protein